MQQKMKNHKQQNYSMVQIHQLQLEQMYICKKRMYYAESDGKKNMDYEDSP